ncbi:unnamed protein product [Effrenium voratum]|nr:unnamed protein product [Effrenium voratum]
MQSMARRLGFCSLVAFGAPLTEENAFWNVNLERRHVPEEYRGGWANHSYFPSPEDWRALSIYQLLTDRFADGDPRNNELAAGGFDVRDMTLRHGGDFKGLTQKLHYIKGLGCRGIWISPIFQNGENSYHQYSQLDFTLLDRRLGTLEELRALTSAAHALGIYVIVDVVMNHMSNEFFFEGHEFGAAPWRFHEDAHGEREYLLRPRRPAKELQQTPAGRQPYMDFWYNNSWDPTAQYPGTLYGQHGEKAVDVGHGTYDSSDFHHNGDLKDYYDPFQIHYGKLYGTMDDLRLEHRRVQAKYIAMTKALISSCDVDGFRVDTPMQVPLVFYKAWAPAMRKHALGLGKKSFGLFGEFYVTPERYATMTGRGKDQAMYGTESFIEGPATMKGGIVYSYYWYMFTAFVYNQPQYADGFPLAYAEESNMLDTYDEASGQKQYAMWNFCNNHDNWRLQAMTSTRHLLLCLVVITFWPGIPLHYAGDEQNLGSPGSALDGWSREELGSSLAWQAVTVTPSGNPADGDNFDMTAPNYLFIARLNALRRSYFGDFGREECDKLVLPESPIPDVLAFSRGCTEEGRVLVVANFHGTAFRSARLRCKWPKGTKLQDTLEPADPLALLAGEDGEIALQLRPLQSLVLAPAPLRRLPPVVVSVSPSHGAVLAQLQGEVQLRIRFDRPMQPTARAVTLDGEGIFSCLDDTCQEVGATVQLENLCDGTHRLEAPEGLAESLSGDSVGKTEASFRSYFIVDRHSGIVAEPRMHEHRGLICDLGRKLCHNAAGAGWLRIRDVGGNWTAWRPYEEQSDWRATKGVGVLVQYHAEGSASFIAGDCMVQPLQRCHSSWHRHMHLRGDFNQWGEAKDLSMQKVEHFTWAANFTTDTFVKVKFAPEVGWLKSYGLHPSRKLHYGLPLFDKRSKSFQVEPFMSGAEASRRWMMERGRWSKHQSVATGADFATDVWISHLCTPEPPPCPPPSSDEADWQCHSYQRGENLDWCQQVGTVGCVTYAVQNFSEEMSSCGKCDCCRKLVAQLPTGPKQTCCILFNDLLLNYTVTPDLSLCTPQPVKLAPAWTMSPDTAFQVRSRCGEDSGPVVVQERQATEESEDTACAPSESSSLETHLAVAAWSALLVILLLCHAPSRIYLSIVRQAGGYVLLAAVSGSEAGRHVVFASIEHVVPERNVNACTGPGDTGIFLDLMEEHPPGTLSMVHPILAADYGELDWYSELAVVVDGKIQAVQVLRLECEKNEGSHKVVWYFLKHELFLDRTQESLYPEPLSKLRSLRFYSLWNQSVAMLLETLKPEVFHCMDWHQALAPLYLDTACQIPMVLLLRQGAMGSVDSESLSDRFWKTVSPLRRMSLVFNLKIPTIRRYCIFEGRFNMLKAGIQFISETQHGRGICVLSAASTLRREHRLLQGYKLRALGQPSLRLAGGEACFY